MAEQTDKQPKKRVVHRKVNPVYRQPTLRKMPPFTRKVAELIGEATHASRQLKAMLPQIRKMEEKEIKRQKEVEQVIDRIK